MVNERTVAPPPRPLSLSTPIASSTKNRPPRTTTIVLRWDSILTAIVALIVGITIGITLNMAVTNVIHEQHEMSQGSDLR